MCLRSPYRLRVNPLVPLSTKKSSLSDVNLSVQSHNHSMTHLHPCTTSAPDTRSSPFNEELCMRRPNIALHSSFELVCRLEMEFTPRQHEKLLRKHLAHQGDGFFSNSLLHT
ncbi:unnamed protein product [Pleuronectes platessa]|uniref:Uncharacterized protein n=1 Tax=Pleuronectes platessa TaxID=8262 RepID=A0A9N7YLZ6_PLEPL|nr:unnamed protein product [Pleuronectes platessa]